MGMDRKIKKKKWPPKKIITLVSILAFVGIVAYLLIFKVSKSTLNVNAERLTISTVTKGPFQEFIAVMGNAEPEDIHYLTASDGGRVEEIFIEAGAMVQEGDKILRLANTNLLLDIMFREAELFQQSNNLRNTRLSMDQYKLQLVQDLANIDNMLQQQKRVYERYQQLAKDDLIAKHEFEIAEDQYRYLQKRKDLTLESQKNDLEFRQGQIDALEASLSRMTDNLEVVKGKLDNLTVRAPVSGHLTSLIAEIGEQKNAGTPFGQIDVMRGFKVVLGIDEHYLPRLEINRKGTFVLADQSYELVVDKIYPEVMDGRFEVDMSFVGQGPSNITRGMTFHIRLELGDISEAILLPRGGFFQTTGGNWIYILDESGNEALKTSIRVGRWNTDVYEVLEGLQPGDRVITSGYENYGDMERLVLKRQNENQ
ncbi:MAG: HlyD family efflux transporter periplasmic adaptor subunit [Candidatus Aminicenantes bacterium]|nr:HlyD family efflux transporter periplasmic adaptor subunit [Candidatus Aminicenantes bacterium]